MIQLMFYCFFLFFDHFQVLWRQFLKFKETELPAKEADKNRSKHIFKSFEVRLCPFTSQTFANAATPAALKFAYMFINQDKMINRQLNNQ